MLRMPIKDKTGIYRVDQKLVYRFTISLSEHEYNFVRYNPIWKNEKQFSEIMY